MVGLTPRRAAALLAALELERAVDLAAERGKTRDEVERLQETPLDPERGAAVRRKLFG